MPSRADPEDRAQPRLVVLFARRVAGDAQGAQEHAVRALPNRGAVRECRRFEVE